MLVVSLNVLFFICLFRFFFSPQQVVSQTPYPLVIRILVCMNHFIPIAFSSSFCVTEIVFDKVMLRDKGQKKCRKNKQRIEEFCYTFQWNQIIPFLHPFLIRWAPRRTQLKISKVYRVTFTTAVQQRHTTLIIFGSLSSILMMCVCECLQRFKMMQGRLQNNFHQQFHHNRYTYLECGLEILLTRNVACGGMQKPMVTVAICARTHTTHTKSLVFKVECGWA